MISFGINGLTKSVAFVLAGYILFYNIDTHAIEKSRSRPRCNGLDTRKWHNCFGTFFFEGGSKYTGTWKNGLPNFEYSATGALLGQNEFDEAARKVVINEVKKQRKLDDKVSSNRDNLPVCRGKFGVGWNNCFGKQKFENGTYEGAFKNGLYDGFGVFQLESGEQYIGEFKANLKHGFGRWSGFRDLKNAPIDRNTSQFEWYEGYFENGVKQGKGTFYFENGDIYAGEFKNDVRSGLGTLKYKSGDRYEGGWLNDLQEGHGSLHDEEGIEIFSGIYKNGKKSGIFTYAGKDKVGETTYVDDVIHGVVYFKSKRETLLGKVRNGTPYGVGLVVKENGENVFSIFRDGEKYISIKNTGLANEYVIGVFDKEKFLPVLDQGKEWVRIKEELIDLYRADSNVFIFQEKFPERIFYQKLLAHFQVNARVLDERSQKLEIFVEHSEPRDDGSFTVIVKTNRDTASLTVDGVEEGGSADGNYIIKRVARAGQKSSILISATDVFGNSASKTITVSRPLAESKPLAVSLNPAIVKRQPERDAVAIIIGIADYKNLPRADYANDDARVFYDYAIRAFGIKPENIKLLVDADADEVGIYRAFKTWLPSRVRPSTDVYVYYSGHGLPTADGQGLYVLPQRADRDFVEETAIKQAEINAAIQAAKPKSVTIFLDACYSGQARTGETLLASARPVSLKAEIAEFPKGFTVITASRGDQLSSSSLELKHGIFSFYLMRGLEGDADANKDGRITTGEMQAYLAANVARQAAMMNRLQEPQLIGDANRVLVGR